VKRYRAQVHRILYCCLLRLCARAYVVESDGLCLIEKLMETLDEDELEVEVTVARKIWLCRNYVVYGGSFYPPSQVAQSAK
jgi:hypothetical protein